MPSKLVEKQVERHLPCVQEKQPKSEEIGGSVGKEDMGFLGTDNHSLGEESGPQKPRTLTPTRHWFPYQRCPDKSVSEQEHSSPLPFRQGPLRKP